MKILILCPVSYPFYLGGDIIFLQNEIPFLSENFDEIIVLPHAANGEKQEINFANVYIDISLANYIKQKPIKILNKSIQFLNLSFYKELFYSKSFLKIAKIRKTLSFLAQASRIKIWFIQYIRDKNLYENNILIYTYWTTSTTFGLSKLKKQFPNIRVISRVHGIDLYEERGSVCCRKETLHLIDQIYAVSIAGVKYLSNLYPSYKEKIVFAPLGVKKHNYNKNHINDFRKFVIVSCSQIISIKRVDLIAKALCLLNNISNLGVDKIVWYHFGDGELKEELKNIIINIDSKSVEVNLMGHKKNEELMEFYSTQYVNLFITTSCTEGGRPISIQEALSFGIPILATKVGGIPEIVSESVGRLLSDNPSPKEIYETIIFFY